ncbi:MAG: M3 family oligoendopeptidase [Patescibacteria group bacterium]
MINNKIPNWDLSDIYKSTTDPKIKTDKDKVNKLVDNFNKKYKGKLSSLLLPAIKDIETITDKLNLLSGFSYLIYSTNTKDYKISHFYQEIQEFISTIESKIVWFEVELVKSSTQINEYKHYLNKVRSFKPFTLDEKSEVILKKKDQTSNSAFVRFYDEIDSRMEFDKKTYSEIAAIFQNDKNRNKRKNAGLQIAKNLKDNFSSYLFILNTLLLDKKIDDEIRNFNFPQQATFFSYEVDQKIVDAMSKVISSNYSISERYYKAKSKIIGSKLYEWDRYNDIYPDIKQKIDWDQSKEIILNTFKGFSDEFYKMAKDFFDFNWIDAKVKIGKTSGAYCSYVSNSIHPYVFMNFTNDSSSVRTLAHELGHAVHGVLSKENSVLEYRPSTATAEIASVFSEAIIFDELYKKAKTKKEKINLLGNKLQETFATVFRQNAFFKFESELHEKRRKDGELSLETVNNLYQKHLQPMFGKGLTLSDNHKYMWMIISHFYHYNFYVFTYSFGELLAMSLYAIYKKEGQKFVEKYVKALSLGGSKSPTEITKTMGVTITDEKFWEAGIELINDRVKEFEQLVI